MRVHEILRAWITATLKERMNLPVVRRIQQRAACRIPVTPGAAKLLVIRVNRSRKIGVNDEADVWLVDPQSECIGGDKEWDLVGHEPVLRFCAYRRLESAVVHPR